MFIHLVKNIKKIKIKLLKIIENEKKKNDEEISSLNRLNREIILTNKNININNKSGKEAINISKNEDNAFELNFLPKKNIKESMNEKQEEKLDDFELNNLEFDEAILFDKRSFGQVYWSILKRENLILFSICSPNDFNLNYAKFERLIFLVCQDMVLNVFFFSDDSMNRIFLSYGKYDFIQHIPQFVYSTLVSQIIDIFLCYLSLTDKHIYQIKNLKKYNDSQNVAALFEILKCIKIKIYSFFSFTFILFIFYWYIITAFCSIYKNTQGIFIKDSISSFISSLIISFFLYLFPSCLRTISLNICKRKLLYSISNIIPIF